MEYDVFLPYEREDSGLGDVRSLMQRPVDHPVYIASMPDYTVSPNPFTDNVSITGSNTKYTGNTSYISIYDTDGRVVFSTTYTGNLGQLNLADLNPGFYILKIRDSESGKIEVKQIIKGWK